jgi:hypothetical protein
MRSACWMNKATNTHWGYVILITFPRQQWLRERALVLTFVRSLPVSLEFILCYLCSVAKYPKNSVEPSPSWEEIPPILWNPKLHNRILKRPRPMSTFWARTLQSTSSNVISLTSILIFSNLLPTNFLFIFYVFTVHLVCRFYFYQQCTVYFYCNNINVMVYIYIYIYKKYTWPRKLTADLLIPQSFDWLAAFHLELRQAILFIAV